MSEHEKFADDLPLYALGALDGPDRDAVEAHARSCDQCSRELQRLNADLALLALTPPLQQPPDRAKARLMTAIAKEPKATAIKGTPRARWWMLIPSAVSLGLLFVVFALWNNNRAILHDLEAVKREVSQARLDSAHAQQVMKLLVERDAMHVTLVATNAKPQPTGKAIYSPKSGALMFFASNFTPAPPEKAYELWILPEKGAPIPAGTFKPDASGNAMMMMPPVPKDVQAQGFGITMEKAEGSTTPTLPILLLGKKS
jgi:anti-sigma-K factor RskA